MFYKYEYKTQNEKESLLTTHSNLILIEEQNIIEGDFLVFSDTPIPVQTVYQSGTNEFEKVSNDNLILMDALATTFEEVLNLQAQIATLQGGTV